MTWPLNEEQGVGGLDPMPEFVDQVRVVDNGSTIERRKSPPAVRRTGNREDARGTAGVQSPVGGGRGDFRDHRTADHSIRPMLTQLSKLHDI